MAAKKKPAQQSAEEQVAAELVRGAKEQGLSLTGPDGLLKQLTKTAWCEREPGAGERESTRTGTH